MRVVIQRVSEANVIVEECTVGQINQGLLILLGIASDDTVDDINWLTQKIIKQRIFSNDHGKMNVSVEDIKGNILLVSQFTLFAETKSGNRPSYTRSAKSDIAIPLYDQMIQSLSLALGKRIESGIFGADMKVILQNDGPVTIIMDSKVKEL